MNMEDFRLIDPNAFISAIEQAACGRIGQVDNKAFMIAAKETKPASSFKVGEILRPYDNEKDIFHCKNCHEGLIKTGKNLLRNFPHCCKQHSKLLGKEWFEKKDYNYLPKKAADTIAYTWHCISESLDLPDWKKRITDYIDYTCKSFGQFPADYGAPLGFGNYYATLEHSLKELAESPKTNLAIKNKLKELILWMQGIIGPKQGTEQDLNILLDTYQAWKKNFPFEISFLKTLKPRFENQFPFLKSIEEPNLYTGQAAGKLFSKEELLDSLIRTTKKILAEINTLTLRESGALTDSKKHLLELTDAKRRQELKEMLLNTSPDEGKRYRRIIKKWLKNELEYAASLKEIFKEPAGSIPASSSDAVKVPLPAGSEGNKPNEQVNIFCKRMPLLYAREHFKPLTENNALNEEPFLTKDALENFIQRAFVGNKDIPEQVINCNQKEEFAKVVSGFYSFFLRSGREWESTIQLKKKYVRLLTDNFVNWDYKKVHDNFNRKPKKPLWDFS